MQLDSKLFGEVRVEPQHLDGKLYFVDNALAGTVTTAKQFEIFDHIALPISVFVMNGFFRVKFAAKVFRHHVAMFEHFGFGSIVSKCGNRNPNVSISFEVPPVISFVEFVKRLLALVTRFAFYVAKLLLCVNATSWFATTALFFATLKAGKSLPQHRIFAASDRATWNRAVSRILTILFPIKLGISRFYGKRGFAFPAVKFEQRFVSSGATVRSLVRSFTAAAAELPFGSRCLNAERFVALKANLFDACCNLVHVNLLFGDRGYSTHRFTIQLART